MKRIHKYVLPIMRDSAVDLPRGAEVLRAQVQYNLVTLWAIVDPKQPEEARNFTMLVTGEGFELTSNMKFIDTVQLNDGAFVLHIFEIIPQGFIN